MEKIIVQKNTVDEFLIAYTLEGNLNSKNLLVMLHGGGMDHHEKEAFPRIQNGQNEKRQLENGKSRTILEPMFYGNYDRIVGEIEARDLDLLTLRIDLRNHGESKKIDGTFDERDLQVKRYVRDISDVIDYIVNAYNIENIDLMGTCFGGLIAQCYVLGIGINESCLMKDRDKIKSLILNCPLSFLNLYTENEADKFSYNKSMLIKYGPEGTQFNKMPGVYEGKETIKEAQYYGNIAPKLGESKLPILYLYGKKDRLIAPTVAEKITGEIKNENQRLIVRPVDDTYDHGFADHCLYDPQSSDVLIRAVMEFLENQLALRNNNENQNKMKF